MASSAAMARAIGRCGFDWSRAVASITLLAIVILSLGSVPTTVAADPDDFCRPMYPSDASFCISEELNSAEDLPASPLKWRSDISTCAPLVSRAAFDACARVCGGTACARESYTSRFTPGECTHFL